MHSTKVASNPVSSTTNGTKDNPYSSDEAYSLIDEGAFKGGYVIDSNGLVSYWLGRCCAWCENRCGYRRMDRTNRRCFRRYNRRYIGGVGGDFAGNRLVEIAIE